VSDQFEHPDHAAIVEMATLVFEVNRPPGVASLAAQGHVSGAAAGRDLFLNVFVAQALDGVDSLLDRDKQYIAEKAAEFASQGVDALRSSIASLKVYLYK
jgi:hypothetical protein